MQAEFDQLQCEIDNILDNTHFNTKNIFGEHEPTYTQLEGNLTWNQNGVHIIDDSMNELVINYRKDENGLFYADLIVSENTIKYYLYTPSVQVNSSDSLQIWFRRISGLYEIGLYNLEENN